MRPVTLTTGVSKFAEGSCQVAFGETVVRVTCSVDDRVPPHLLGTGSGWVTAEYGMLPRATLERNRREATQGKQSGRTLEIQRLIGRSLRAAVNLKELGLRTFTLDCDVLQADGGTRTAAITGAYVALALALRAVKAKRALTSDIAVRQVAAMSVGLSASTVLVDLDYAEDSTVDVDLNVVGMPGGKLVEIQGTAEHQSFTKAELDAMVDAAVASMEMLFLKQAEALA